MLEGQLWGFLETSVDPERTEERVSEGELEAGGSRQLGGF